MYEEEFEKRLKELARQIPQHHYKLLTTFFEGYKKSVLDFEKVVPTLLLFLQFVKDAFNSPFNFSPYHQKIRSPVDYHQFGLNFVRPLIDLQHSRILGMEHLESIEKWLKKKENVILLANHQTESDPQTINILLEKTHKEVGDSIIYVAGERVVTDPLAIPFSMGCDLLCIYSKRYIDYPPENKAEKQLHNKKTMQLMSRLLEEGGKMIYVAPSGGRDRKNAQGIIEVAPFDADSIEMFYLMAKKAKTPTHFIPFTLATYDLLPPPETVQIPLGEERHTKRTPVHIAFAPVFNMDHFTGSEEPNKLLRRQMRAKAIWNIVNTTYQTLSRLL